MLSATSEEPGRIKTDLFELTGVGCYIEAEDEENMSCPFGGRCFTGISGAAVLVKVCDVCTECHSCWKFEVSVADLGRKDSSTYQPSPGYPQLAEHLRLESRTTHSCLDPGPKVPLKALRQGLKTFCFALKCPPPGS